ncbi:MAG TPA: dolichyl-phosphate beta-glucosyltransferase [Herpetosiphonaceae bacterium]
MTTLLSVVVPAYNEERRLQATLEAILAFAADQPFDAEVIVVDDGSTDATVQIAERIQATQPRLRVIRNDHRGKGYTVRTGMLLAQGRYILFTDADLAVPMDEWSKLLPAFESGYDIAIGSREGLGARRLGEPRYRHFMGRIFNAVVRLIALGGIQDTQCGFKAFRREVAHRIFSSVQLYGADAKLVQGAAVTAFDVEVLFLARKFGYRIKEVPVTWRYGVETKVDPIRDSWRNFSDVVRVRWNDLRGRYTVVPSLPKKTTSK